MLVYQQREFLIFVLHSFLCGAFLGAVYDFFRISRILLGITISYPKSADRLYRISYPVIGKISVRSVASGRAAGVLLFFSDILFSLIAASSVLVVTFFRNDGKIRAECLFITAVGFLLYYVSIGRLTMLFSSYIAFLIRLLSAYVKFVIMLPLRIIYGIVKKMILCLCGFISGRIRVYIISKESKKYTSYIRYLSRNAFLDITPYKTKKGNGMTYGTEKEI